MMASWSCNRYILSTGIHTYVHCYRLPSLTWLECACALLTRLLAQLQGMGAWQPGWEGSHSQCGGMVGDSGSGVAWQV